MSAEFRFVLADFRCIGEGGAPRLHEAGRSFPMPPAVAHAAAKRELVAKARSPHWTPPNRFRRAETPSAAEIAAAEAELGALQCYGAEITDPGPIGSCTAASASVAQDRTALLRMRRCAQGIPAPARRRQVARP